MFLTNKEEILTNEFLINGYVIRKVENIDALNWIRKKFLDFSKTLLELNKKSDKKNLLDQIHLFVSKKDLNHFRLRMIEQINDESNFRKKYFSLAKKYLEILVGNELAMQLRVNLSIQLPDDDSSLLPVHADTWSGDSPFEVVIWVPLVDCFRSKSMYLLPPNDENKLILEQSIKKGKSSEELFKIISEKIIWLDVNYGELLIFNQALPHGNRINNEKETRWSMNCRFKGVFTPYNDKKIGEFFEPITLRAASRAGMNYKLPEIF